MHSLLDRVIIFSVDHRFFVASFDHFHLDVELLIEADEAVGNEVNRVNDAAELCRCGEDQRMRASIRSVADTFQRQQLAILLLTQRQEPAFVLRFREAAVNVIGSFRAESPQIHHQRVFFAGMNFVPLLVVNRLLDDSLDFVLLLQRSAQLNLNVDRRQFLDDFVNLLDFRLGEFFAQRTSESFVVLEALFFQ